LTRGDRFGSCPRDDEIAISPTIVRDRDRERGRGRHVAVAVVVNVVVVVVVVVNGDDDVNGRVTKATRSLCRRSAARAPPPPVPSSLALVRTRAMERWAERAGPPATMPPRPPRWLVLRTQEKGIS
jgi:hypothetical protein